MSQLDQEFHVSREPWGTTPVNCHKCGWKGTEENLEHVFEENVTLPDEDHFHQVESEYLGAFCPDCQEPLIFQCLECSWHGTSPADGPTGFPACPECGARQVSLQVRETTWHLFRNSVAVEAQLGFDFTN